MGRKIKLALFCGGLFCVFDANAQVANVDTYALIESCEKSSVNQSERITCLESALRQSLPKVPARAVRPVPSELILPETAPNPVNVPNAVSVSEPIVVRVPEQKTALPIVRNDPGLDFGSEQLPEHRSKSKSVSVNAQVIDYAFDRDGKIVVVLENGQAWKQRGGDRGRVRVSRGEMPKVIIEKGVVSGYRMEFVEQKMKISVSRIR